jgi:hypothetical protein
MAHWAELDENNIVIRVLVGDNDDPNGDEGYQWLLDNLGGTWIKTSYNTLRGVHKEGGTPLRGNYAGIGSHYIQELDIFLGMKPYPSWIPDEEEYIWKAPVDVPDSGFYDWDEETLSWVEGSGIRPVQ